MECFCDLNPRMREVNLMNNRFYGMNTEMNKEEKGEGEDVDSEEEEIEAERNRVVLLDLKHDLQSFFLNAYVLI